MVIGLAVPVTMTGEPLPEGVAVTVYPVTALPPSEEGGENVTVAWALPGAADTLRGAVGIVRGVTETVAEAPGPAALTAHTASVYAVPFVRLVTV